MSSCAARASAARASRRPSASIAASDGRLAAEAEAVLVHYDWETGTSRPLTDEIRTAFARWLLD